MTVAVVGLMVSGSSKIHIQTETLSDISSEKLQLSIRFGNNCGRHGALVLPLGQQLIQKQLPVAGQIVQGLTTSGGAILPSRIGHQLDKFSSSQTLFSSGSSKSGKAKQYTYVRVARLQNEVGTKDFLEARNFSRKMFRNIPRNC